MALQPSEAPVNVGMAILLGATLACPGERVAPAQLGVTDLPRVAVHDVRRDYLLGFARNADGAESVVIHDVSWTVKRND